MKQFEPKDVTVNSYKFHIYPFPAFKAANISGELMKVIGPVLGGLASILGGKKEGSSLLDIDIDEKNASALAGAFSSIDGDKVESLLKKLLVSNRNITVELDNGAEYVTEDTLNELFCGSVESMYVLAFHVVKVNFGGFFKNFDTLFGDVEKKLHPTVAQTNTEN